MSDDLDLARRVVDALDDTDPRNAEFMVDAANRLASALLEARTCDDPNCPACREERVKAVSDPIAALGDSLTHSEQNLGYDTRPAREALEAVKALVQAAQKVSEDASWSNHAHDGEGEMLLDVHGGLIGRLAEVLKPFGGSDA